MRTLTVCSALSFAVALFAAACSNPSQPPGNFTPPAIGPGQPTPPRTWRGLYTPGKEGITFRDCADGKTYRVKDETDSLARLYETAAQPVPYPNEAVYAVLQGRLMPPESGDGVLHVTRVDTLSPKSMFNNCVPFEFWCLGTEPFWDLQVSQAENGIFYQDAATERGEAFPWSAPIVTANTWTYTSVSNSGKRLKLVITRAACNDGMSDTEYEYEVSLSIGEEKRTGCAVRGGAN